MPVHREQVPQKLRAIGQCRVANGGSWAEGRFLLRHFFLVKHQVACDSVSEGRSMILTLQYSRIWFTTIRRTRGKVPLLVLTPRFPPRLSCCSPVANLWSPLMSLYARLGGEPAFQTAVDIFYRRMLSDDRVARFFDDVDMEGQIAKQKAFLTFVTGGPAEYTGQDMRDAHAHLVKLGIDDEHVDVVIEHLGAVLTELGADAKDVGEVAALAESVRDQVLGR